MGSVKSLVTIFKPTEENVGMGRFKFSDDYSVFDWGKMPDKIKNKGSAIATMAAFNFELMQDRGINTHYQCLIAGKNGVAYSSELKNGSNGSNVMGIDLGFVHKPKPIITEGKVVGYDYSLYDKKRGELDNYLIPLEVIFRRALPEGSSVFRKIVSAKKIENSQDRDSALQKIYDSLGVKSEPKPGDVLPKTVIGYTTKLEAGDRHLTSEEAYQISGLTREDFGKIEKTTMDVEELITKRANETGFEHFDGKVEYLWDGMIEKPVVADVVGTLDENRFGFNGEQVSKQFLRKTYQTTQPEFEEACIEWKKTGPGWQERCPVKPKQLDPRVIELTSQMYQAATNQYLGRDIFANVPPLKEVINDLRPFR